MESGQTGGEDEASVKATVRLGPVVRARIEVQVDSPNAQDVALVLAAVVEVVARYYPDLAEAEGQEVLQDEIQGVVIGKGFAEERCKHKM